MAQPTEVESSLSYSATHLSQVVVLTPLGFFPRGAPASAVLGFLLPDDITNDYETKD